MQNLINVIKQSLINNPDVPYSVYSSIKEQQLLNVPIAKPVFIAVLDGDKKLGKNSDIVCHAGDFIFLADSPAINMRNIPKEKEYFALLIEFDYEDFAQIEVGKRSEQGFCVGAITIELETCLQQFVEWARYAPQQMWSLRRKEIIQLLCHMGHKDVLSMVGQSKISHRLHELFSAELSEGGTENLAEDMTLPAICERLAMSESTLRRKLKTEGSSVQEIKDQTKLGLGLHLLQTTEYSIGLIAEKCGYLSQSRFSDRFKGRFGLTPSELRKTK